MNLHGSIQHWLGHLMVIGDADSEGVAGINGELVGNVK